VPNADLYLFKLGGNLNLENKNNVVPNTFLSQNLRQTETETETFRPVRIRQQYHGLEKMM